MDWSGLAGSTVMSTDPYYQRVISDIRTRVASGEWPPGTKLPSTRELVRMYQDQLRSPSLSISTVRRAVGLLTAFGELRGDQGLGVFVVGRDDGQASA